MKTLRNSVLLIGHLGQDPEVKKLDNGTVLTKVSLATNEKYRNTKGEQITTTQWHKCIAWGKTAEIMGDLLKKGKEVVVKGKLQYSQYQDKNGVNRSLSQVVVREFIML